MAGTAAAAVAGTAGPLEAWACMAGAVADIAADIAEGSLAALGAAVVLVAAAARAHAASAEVELVLAPEVPWLLLARIARGCGLVRTCRQARG